MFKITFASAILALSLVQPVFAEDAMKSDAMMKCDDASMMKLQTEMDAVKDESMKMMAMKEMDMAKASMKADKMDDCAMHMEGAMKAIKG